MNGDLIYVGCYTGEGGGKGEGISVLHRDPESGALTALGLVAHTPSPSFLARHPALPVLYAVNELDEGTVSSWSVGERGALTPLAVRATGGRQPCHLAVTADGRYLLSANYGSGSIAVHPLDADGVPGERVDLVVHDGRGPDPQRQDGPHAHMVAPDPRGPDVLAVDLGADRVYRYRLDPVSGRLTAQPAAVVAAPGTGPRHLARHPDGAVYLLGELSGTLTAYRPDPAHGALRAAGTVRTSAGPGLVMPSEIVISPDGRFSYVGNRGPDTVAVFAGDADEPVLLGEVPTGGTWPRHVVLLGGWLYVANERSHTVTTFRVEAGSGIPVPHGPAVDLPSPTCLLRYGTAGG